MDDQKKPAFDFAKFFKSTFYVLLKILAIIAVLFFSYIFAVYILLLGPLMGMHIVMIVWAMLLLPTLLIPLVIFKHRNKVAKVWGIFAAAFLVAFVINVAWHIYDESITVDVSPSIRTYEYMPFDEKSKIVRLPGEASLKLEDNLPKVDGAAAVFPVYSAFVNAVYPGPVELSYWYPWDDVPDDGVFQYNNTVEGYQALAHRDTDIFFGGYPSEDQINYAAEQSTTFVYTPIGYEAFVFFVHKDNPIDNLTTEQIQAIYAGQITNWAEIGGANERIAAFQRNESSGSQSMMQRFMGDKKIMDPPTEWVSGSMGGVTEAVSDYKSTTAAIGYSFRYYMEGIIRNPDIKLLSIDGVAPTPENIKNGTYPITTPLYAVTWEGNGNENIQKLIDWILSDEGQYIIEKTGYVGISD